MRLATFVGDDGEPRVGALLPEGSFLADLQRCAERIHGRPSPHFASMMDLLRGGETALDQAREMLARTESADAAVPLAGVRLLAPVPRPASMRDCVGFMQHMVNSARAVGFGGRLARIDRMAERMLGPGRSLAHLATRHYRRRPAWYFANPGSVVGPDAEVRMPPYTRRFDYGLEWGVFIHRQGCDIPRGRARQHIAGYTIYNDFSARDAQFAEMKGRLGPAKGKHFDTGNALGPWLVTPDEIPEPYALTMTARVNGAEWSRGSSRDMYWSFEDLIEYVSRSETLFPGDFIASGTCSGPQGAGCGLELGAFLAPGDVVELEVERIGVLRNRVVGTGYAPLPERAGNPPRSTRNTG